MPDQSLRIFLSHSSQDKKIVRRVSLDLKSHGFDPWLDEEQIPFGERIPSFIERGLRRSDVLIVFLSTASVQSDWVKTEMTTKFVQQLNERRIIVIPLLLDDCSLPSILADRRYADFRQSDKYEENLSLLLARLGELALERELLATQTTTRHANSILEDTRDMLEELDSQYLSFPMQKRIPIVASLKVIPRSGKKIRLESFRPKVKARSVYDHILSVAHVADALLPHFNHGLIESDRAELARCFAYHEITEVILGDIPTYTSLSTGARKDARIYAEERLRTLIPKERRRIANDCIRMFLSDKHRHSLDTANENLSDESAPLFKAYKVFDKIDPIIATWRYLHHYRGRLGEDPREFNRKMGDFFRNPDIRYFLRNNAFDPRLLDLVGKLQDRRHAWDYYADGGRAIEAEEGFGVPAQAVVAAIEGIPLFDAPEADQAPARPVRIRRH